MVHLLGTTNCPGRPSFQFVKVGIDREVGVLCRFFTAILQHKTPAFSQNQEELSLVPGDSNSGLGLQVERGKQELGFLVRDKHLDTEECREVVVYPGQL